METLTTIARDATDVLNSATGREIAVAPGQALEADIAEPVSPPDTMPIAHTSRIREEIHNLDQNSEVFEEEFDNIAQVHCQNDLFEFELSDQPPRQPRSQSSSAKIDVTSPVNLIGNFA